MDNSSTSYITIAITSFSLIVGTIVYFNMGCSQSASVDSTGKKKTLSEKERISPKESVKGNFPAGELKVYFGSQTGTAEGFARVLMEEGKGKGFDATMIDLEDFSPENLQDSRIAIFLVATYGNTQFLI